MSLILDGLVATLLVATIAYCAVLSRRLAALRRDKADLHQAIASFNEATSRAETGLARLKETGEAVSATLQEQMEEAQARYDELAFVMERADRLVSVLGPSISTAGRRAAPSAAPSAARGEGAGGAARGVDRKGGAPASGLSRAERELLETLESAR